MSARCASGSLIAVGLMMLVQSVLAAPAINIAVREDFSLSPTYVRILTEVYRRAGIPVKFTHLPGGSSLKYSNNGELGIDGEAGRLPAVLKTFDNLVKVDPPIILSELMVFSRKPGLVARQWQDLAGQTVTTRLGFKAVINSLDANNLKLVEDSKQALLLVAKGRADVAVLTRDDGMNVLESLNLDNIHIQPVPIEVLPVHHMLHKRHAGLVPRLNTALSDMAAEGTLARLADMPELTLTTGIRYPMVDGPQGPGFVEKLLQTAFGRIGVKASLALVPSKLSLLNANSGQDDGLALRIAGLEKKYTNLIRIPEVLMCNEFVAFTKGKALSIAHWEELQSHDTAYLNGWRIFERNLPPGDRILKLDNPLLLFSMLERKRTEVALYEKWQGLALAREANVSDIHGNRLPIPQTQMFVYLHNKHSALVEPLAQALRDMKRDASYRNIYDASLATVLPTGQRDAGYESVLSCQ